VKTSCGQHWHMTDTATKIVHALQRPVVPCQGRALGNYPLTGSKSAGR
jgi:hypothetical protein